MDNLQLRQAAMLLSALPKPELAAILKRLEPAQAAALAGQLSRLSQIDSAELNVAIGRFLSACQFAPPAGAKVGPLPGPAANTDARRKDPAPASPTAKMGTLDQATEIGERASPYHRIDSLQAELAGPHVAPDAAGSGGVPLLEELPLAQCLQLLAGEDVGLVAAVVFALSPKKAAAVVERIPFNRRVQVFEMLAGIESLSAATLEHIRQRLARKLEFGNDLHTRPEGMHRARHLLEQLSPAVQRGIADALAVHSPQLAAELHRNVFRFNDLCRLHRADLEKVLPRVAPETWRVALQHADQRVRELVSAVAGSPLALQVATPEAGEVVDEQTASDAQQEVVEVVHDLFRKRMITRPRVDSQMRRAAA